MNFKNFATVLGFLKYCLSEIYSLNVRSAPKLRHTVVFQWPRKQKKTQGTQVCYLLVPQSCQIQPFVSPKLLYRFLPNLHIFFLTYTQLHISKLKEIPLVVLEIFVPENCPIFFTFFFFFFFSFTQNYKYI